MKLWHVAGAILAVGAVAVHFVANSMWGQRIPRDWSWESKFVGVATFADPKTGEIPKTDTPAIFIRSIQQQQQEGRPVFVMLKDTYAILDPATGKRTWEYVVDAKVNPGTGEHLLPEFRGEYFVFPRDVSPRTYKMRFSYLKGLPLAFIREEIVEDLHTYLFAYKGRGEYTESYAGTDQYPGVKVQPGQEIRCADDQYSLNLWVEPLTGEIIKWSETCLSGDELFDVKAGKHVAWLERWAGDAAGSDVQRNITLVKAQRKRILWGNYYLPAILLLAAVACLIIAARRIKPA